MHKGSAELFKARSLMGQIPSEEPLDEIPVGLIAPDETGGIPLHLDDPHGQHVKSVMESVLFRVGDHAQVIEVDAADGVIVSGLQRIFGQEGIAIFAPVEDLLIRHRLAVIIPLQL